jgi:putative FmdB family regulatory protein
MPTYVYECKTCEKRFEVEQRIVEDPLTDCDCGANGALRRVIQPVGIAFKGSGFYVNDAGSSAAASSSEAPACSGEPKSCPACAPTTSDA